MDKQRVVSECSLNSVFHVLLVVCRFNAASLLLACLSARRKRLSFGFRFVVWFGKGFSVRREGGGVGQKVRAILREYRMLPI